MKITERIKLSRDIHSDFHFEVANEWMTFGISDNLPTPLVYCAFEFRNCIERIALELLLLYREGKLTEEDSKALGKLNGIIGYIVEINGHIHTLERKMFFVKCVAELTNIPQTIAVFNVGSLTKHWQTCSSYCHKNLIVAESLMNPEYVAKGYSKMRTVKDFLSQICGHAKAEIKITDPDVLQIQEDFLNRKIDEVGLRTRLELIQPVLQQRMRLRNPD